MSFIYPVLATSEWRRARAVGLLLAAGRGKRYARLSGGADKLLACLPDGRTLAEAAAGHLLEAVPHVLAVVQPGQSVRAARLQAAGCVVIEAPDAERGMGASLAAGARCLLQHGVGAGADGAPALLVALADMPWLRPSTICALLACRPAAAIAVPRYGQRRGHPVRFARDLWSELAGLDADTGARELFARHDVAFLDTADAGVLRDVDVPQALRDPV
ncbi:nucleotidyltransferase family protein [Verticiella sediminum]|uniref:Nucleotidyltransferase family protein n=1 Tax=Verticiella sediminum TaxID=1247510 RepID=A0A556AU81_9BURK|nr:nucleotidyltransferase family protein [Verticiella sediminum]TSH96503.1 nucleotidyltransferase family protein [Verticiella sediminum]